MRILYVSNEYPPETGFGGIGTYTRHMAEAMAQRGHQVHVICRSASDIPASYKSDNLTICRIPAGTYPLPASKLFFFFRQWCYHSIPHTLIRLAWAREVWTEYKRLVSTGIAFDIVEYPDCGAEGYWLAGRIAITSVVRLHTPWTIAREIDRIKEPLPDRLTMAFFERRAIVRATLITSPTADLAQRLHRRWQIGHTVVVPNPILPQAFVPTGSGRWIYTGRVEYRKGVHVLVEAYRLLKETRTPPELLLVGRPFGDLPNGTAYGDYIRKLIETYDLGTSIRWVEGATPEQVTDHLHNASAGIFPSLWENFPYACLEAMAGGLAIVASRCGGYCEMIEEGRSGLLCKPGDVEDLAVNLGRLCGEPGLIAQLGAEASARARNLFSTEAVCPTMEKTYAQAIAKGKKV